MKWTDKTIEILRERYQVDGPVKLAKEFGVTRASVTLKARRLGLTKKINWINFHWNEEMLTVLKERYIAEGGPAVAQAIGAHISTVRRKAVELDLHTKGGLISGGRKRAEARKTCDVHYFDQWCPNMAYTLGFLFADGSITKRLCDVVAAVASSDEAILTFLKKELKSTRHLYYAKRNRGKDGYNRQRAVYLYLGSSILVQRLMDLGMKPRKTYNDDPFPDVPDEMMPDFIRGYFDGDGTAFVSKSGVCCVGFVGSPKFIAGIRDSLVRLVGMKLLSVKAEIYKIPVGRIQWRSNTDVRLFFNYIYPKDHGFCLQRKKSVLENWLSNLGDSDASSTSILTQES